MYWFDRGGDFKRWEQEKEWERNQIWFMKIERNHACDANKNAAHILFMMELNNNSGKGSEWVLIKKKETKQSSSPIPMKIYWRLCFEHFNGTD